MRLIDADALIEQMEEDMEQMEEPLAKMFTGAAIHDVRHAPTVQPERKTGYWILDRSGAYCCSKCMEPCASYVMMRPRDKFCKMCGSRNEVME